MPDIKDYTGKITSEHSDKPKYMATVEAVSQCFLDTRQVVSGLPDDFDLDLANDAQLDDVGLWVGISRRIPTPLTNVYFSLDAVGLGFDQGAWKGPFDPDNGITVLDNETYRALLRAKIGANHLDGTLESSKAVLDLIFNPDGHEPFLPVTASNEQFGVGNGVQTEFQLKYQGQNVYSYVSADIYRTDWQLLQKLYPVPRTNLLRFSEQLDNSAWTKAGGIIVTPNAAVAPDGTISAGKLIAPSGGATASASCVQVVSKAASPIVYTGTIFAKSGEMDVVRLFMHGANTTTARCIVNFDLIAKSVGFISQGTSGFDDAVASIEDAAEGYSRVSVTATTDSNASVTFRVYSMSSVVSVGDGISGIYAWGAQLEQSSVYTSYIQTASAAVTVTDYSAGPFGKITMGLAPLPGAQLTWSGQGTAYTKGNYAYLVDNQDMSISIGLAGDPPSAIQWALLTGGYITPKPQSVNVKYFYSPSTSGPLFGFDTSNQYIAGFDQGSWGNVYS
ncbi:DUF2612 domain-containing protein [Pseudomonas sp. HS6-2]|uniref:DUF2612 domain-containing protein n=1 Tax=Pseudomonas sp. HS6-2 TaxID=3410986 RepID=UPI003BEC00AE